MTKRANGEGSVYRRSDGRWTAAYYVFRPDGGRDRKFVYGKTRAEAAGQLARLVAKTAAGIPLATKTWTVSSYSAHWLEHVVAPRLRPTTVASYRDTLRLHVLPTLGRQTLRRLTPAAIRQLLSVKQASGLSARSVQIIHATLRTMLAEAVREELIERNVASIVRPPPVSQEEVRPWSPEEAAKFLKAARPDRLYALFAVGVGLGLRKGELLGLRWSDVDLEHGLLHVRQTAQRVNGQGMIFGPPKSTRSRRDIPIPGVIAEVLHEHLSRQQLERQVPYWQDTGLVFTSSTGTAVEPRNLARALDSLIVQAGVRRIRMHDLRHTCASLLLAQGVPARVVMDVLGHSQFGITMNLYSHVMPSALREAADAIDRSLGAPDAL
jgi:integrase